MSMTKIENLKTDIETFEPDDNQGEQKEQKFDLKELKELPGKIVSSLRKKAEQMTERLKKFQENHDLVIPAFQKRFEERNQKLTEQTQQIIKQLKVDIESFNLDELLAGIPSSTEYIVRGQFLPPEDILADTHHAKGPGYILKGKSHQ